MWARFNLQVAILHENTMSRIVMNDSIVWIDSMKRQLVDDSSAVKIQLQMRSKLIQYVYEFKNHDGSDYDI